MANKVHLALLKKGGKVWNEWADNRKKGYAHRQVAAKNYDAFISYSRADKLFAIELENALERYKPPKELTIAGRHLNIFRDGSRAPADRVLVTCRAEGKRQQSCRTPSQRFSV
jgi:hypothetical protein